MDYLVEFKNKLKKLRKELSLLLESFESELQRIEEFASLASVVKLNHDAGLGISNFNKDEINNKLVFLRKSIKFENKIDELKVLFDRCGFSIKMPNIAFTGTKSYGGGMEVGVIANDRVISVLEEKEFYLQDDDMGCLFEKFINGDLEQAFRLGKIYVNFYVFASALERYILDLNSLISAIDNDRIKMPIRDIRVLFVNLVILGMDIKDVSKIFGMVLIYDKEYMKKNDNHRIMNSDLIIKLEACYNGDESDLNISDLLLSFNGINQDYFNLISVLNYLLVSASGIEYGIDIKNHDGIYSKISKLYEESRTLNVEDEVRHGNVSVISNCKDIIDRDFYKYLAMVYDSKNDVIISIPDDIDLFYQRLYDSDLTMQMKKHIRKLLKEAVSLDVINKRFRYLNNEQMVVYNNAVYLLSVTDYMWSDRFRVEQLLSEINEILDVLGIGDISLEEELILELYNYIYELSLICSNDKCYVKKYKLNN